MTARWLCTVSFLFSALLAGCTSHSSGPPPTATPKTTAPVVLGDLTADIHAAGELGYELERPVPHMLESPARMVLTDIAPVGSAVGFGNPLFEVNGQPIVVVYGSRPAWRTLGPGVSSGPDVSQLKRALFEMGYAENLTGDAWDSSTTDAVRRFQGAAGLPIDGALELGEIVFLPDEVRVTAHRQVVGSLVTAGAPVIDVAALPRVATANISSDRVAAFVVGHSAVVSLPDGTTPSGTIISVAPVASAGPNGESDLTEVRVRLAAGDGRDLPAVQVEISIREVLESNVLLVPIAALVAEPGGVYRVDVIDRDVIAPIVVTVGLVSDGLAEVSGEGLGAGAYVVVPTT